MQPMRSAVWRRPEDSILAEPQRGVRSGGSFRFISLCFEDAEPLLKAREYLYGCDHVAAGENPTLHTQCATGPFQVVAKVIAPSPKASTRNNANSYYLSIGLLLIHSSSAVRSLASIARTRTRSNRCSLTLEGRAAQSILGIGPWLQLPNNSRAIS